MSFKKPAISTPLGLGEEGVEVNQRYLIDKILARYSSEFVVYRELLQNSDDAKSSKVEIIFETNPGTNINILEDEIITILFKNNGSAFKDEDWKRIKTIAEGNPDERKIGAFGVGFYSLFSICDNPSVISDGKAMNFSWRNDQLITEFGKIDGQGWSAFAISLVWGKDQDWTTFAMYDLRKPEKFPNVDEFTRFLTNSLVFMSNLRHVNVYFNTTLIISLSKELQDPKPIDDITSEFDTYSPNQMFRLDSLNIRDIQMDVKRLLVPKESSEQHSLITDSLTPDSLTLKIANGDLKIEVEDETEFSKEMRRLTKKENLPKNTIIQMMFIDGDYNKPISWIFKDLLPYPEQGRIYIGFSTHQTIGCCSNLSALVIPSVERESIDFVNKTLKEYNIGILSLAGVLCRIFYKKEMSKIEENYKNEDHKQLESHAAHVLRYFTFNKSTPKKSVSKTIEERFFNCSKQELPILSTCGVFPITEVRMPNPKMKGFIKTVPIVPDIVLEYCESFFGKAKEMKLIKELSFQDVLSELKRRSLSEGEIIELMKWWISYRSEKNKIKSDEIEFTQFRQFAKVDKSRPMNTIRYILNSSLIPPDVKIPDDVLPYSISKNFDNSEMKEYFRWDELPLIKWAEFIVDHPDLESNTTFAEKVHKILASGLNKKGLAIGLNTNDENKIRQLFVNKKCIPTTQGMKNPEAVYFQNVDFFPTLPVIQFQEFFDFQNLMKILGVNEVIKIEDMIAHISNGENYDHMKIAKHFGSRLGELENHYLERLKYMKMWPADGQNNKSQRFVASDLHAPLDSNRELRLPIIEWTKKWDHDTKEAKFLIELGLLEYPIISKVLELSATTEKQIRNKALKYFIKNFEEKYSKEYDAAKITIAFLPCSKSGVYAKPLDCFINPDCEVMGFNVIDKDYKDQVEKLGVHQHPSNDKLIEQLIKNKPREAKDTFEYLETRQDGFTKSQWDFLSKSEFIPICNKEHDIIHISPQDCFLKSQGKMEEILGKYSLFIDFGANANKFLKKCGVKNEPSAIKIAELLVDSSRQVWESVGNDVEKYKFILQKLAEDFNNIAKNSDLFTKIKEKPILLGVSEGKKYSLDSVENIYINDDAIYMEVYHDILTAPEHYPKFFYKYLGCKSLKESIKEKLEPLGNTRETFNSQDLQKKFKERAHLFYVDCPKHDIRKGEEWLEKLEVKETDKIEVKYSLKTKNKDRTRLTTACIDEDKGTLYIISKHDYLDISKCLGKYIYKSYKSRDINYLCMMLKTPLEDLEKHSKNDTERDNLQNDSEQQHGDDGNDGIDEIKKSQDSTIADPRFDALKEMFTNCEHYYIRQRLEQAEEDKLINVKEHLMEGNYPKIKIPVIPYDPPVTIQIVKTFMNVIQISRPNLGSYLNENQLIYCEIIKDHSLQFEKFLDGIEFHVPKDIDKSEIFPKYQDSLDQFANILKDLIEVFECAPKFINVFYENSKLMAFNQDRALFFNFKIYLDLIKTETEPTIPTIDAMTYWYMIICHELAHKFVYDHNTEHEHHLSSLATKYMKNLLKIMNKNKKIEI